MSISFPNSSSDIDRKVFIYSVEASIIQSVSLFVIVIAGLAGNSYVCNVILKSNNEVRNPTVMFILNLAVANIGALALCTPFPLAISIKRQFFVDSRWCITSGFLNNFFFCASTFTLSLITTHKYVTVVKPVTCTCLHFIDKRPMLCLIGLWMTSAAVSFVVLGPFSGWGYITFNVTTAHCGISFTVSNIQKFRLVLLAVLAFIAPLFIMTYGYWRIYSKVNTHERRLSNSGTINLTVSPIKKKLTITLCLMFGTFVICWSPFFLLIAMTIFLKDPSDLPNTLGRFAYWFGYINCCINPVVYCLRTSTFKEMMRGRPTSMQSMEIEPRKRRAQSLPVLSTTDRREQSINVARDSLEISPANAIPANAIPANAIPANAIPANAIPATLSQNIRNLRVHRLRAFSWSADYTIAEKMATDIKKSRKSAQKSSELPRKLPMKKINVRNISLSKDNHSPI